MGPMAAVDRPTTDFATARNFMVDGQVRPNKVTDPRIVDAMRKLPRERFLPPSLAASAYIDEDVPLPGGRFLIEPMVIARLIQALALRRGDTLLIVGAGAGYSAAIAAQCGATVTALEDDASLVALGHDMLAEVAPHVIAVGGRLVDGWAVAAPYDAMLIEGAVEAIPPALIRQLRRPGGRLAAIRTGAGRMRQAVLGETAGGQADGIGLQPIFDCGTPLLPQFRREAEFIF